MKKIIAVLFILLGLFALEGCNKKVESNIENWRFYENKEYGYSFKYPERFSIIQPLAQGYLGGNILVDPDIAYITVYVVTTPHPPLKSKPDLTIDGYSAKLTPPFGDYRSGVSIYKGDALIQLYLSNVNKDVDENTDKLIRDIISTIKLS